MEQEFVCVFTTSQEYEAFLVKGLLEDNGIEAGVINKKDSEFLFGHAEVYVKAADKEKALDIIDKREPLGEE